MHLPLNRLAMSVLAALLHQASQPGADPAFLASSEALRGAGALAATVRLSDAAAEPGAGVPAEASPLSLLALSALRVLAWMSQVRVYSL